MMQYKGYVAKVEFDDDDNVFHGVVINTRDIIHFQGGSVEDLRHAFQESVEDYLTWCEKRGEEPDKPFSGKFNLRLSPDLHRQISIAARMSGKSINVWIAECLEKEAQSYKNAS